MNALKEKMTELEKQLRERERALEQKTDDCHKLEKQCRIALDDREKMRLRIIKMKMRKTANLNQKLCKNCGREYMETENFNWSCRTHRVPQTSTSI